MIVFRSKLLFLVTTLIVCNLYSCKTEKEKTPWVNLIQNESLEGWNIKGGEATYKNENGVIIGTTKANTPNTFLTTNEIYSDFIFEIDFKVDSTMNSRIS